MQQQTKVEREIWGGGAREIGAHQVGTVGVRIFLLKIPPKVGGGDRFTIVTIDKFNVESATPALAKRPTVEEVKTAVESHVHKSQVLTRRN